MSVDSKLGKIFLVGSFLFSQSVFAYTEQAANQPYEEALKSFYNTELNSAVIHLKNALKNQPNHLPSLVLLAEVYIAQGDGAAAEDSLIRARQRDADEKKVLPLLLEAYLLQQKYKQVVNNANTNFPEPKIQSELLVLQGRAYVELNNLEQAKLSYQQALDFYSSNIQAQLGVAQVYLLKRQFKQSRAFINKALNISPIDTNALVMLANIEQSEGNTEAALSVISQVIGLSKENFPALLTRASLFIEKQEFQLALADLSVILERIPNEPKANYLKIVASSALGDLKASKETIAHLNMVLSGLPNDIMQQNPVYLYLAGVVSFQQQEYRKAQNVLNKYIDIISEDTRALKLLARTEMALAQFATAKTYLIKARLADPDDVETWSLLGHTLLSLGEIEKAQQYYMDVVFAEQSNFKPLYDLAKLQVLTGQNQHAINNLKKALKMVVKEDILLLLASAYKNDNQLTEALKNIDKLLTMNPDSSFYHQQQGVLLGLLGKHKNAKQALEKSASLDENNLQTLIHLARIDAVEGNVNQAIERIQVKISQQETPDLSLLIELGNLYQNTGDVKSATLYFEKAYSQNRDSQQAITGVLGVYIVNNELSKAITTAKEYLARNNKNGDVYLALANLYMSVKNYKEADNAYVLSIKYSNNKSHVYGAYANAQLKMNNVDGAILSLQRAISWNDREINHYLTLFNLYATNNQISSAEKLLASLKEKLNDESLTERLTGDFYRYSNKSQKAIIHYKRSMAKQVTRAAVFGLYRIYNQEKRFDDSLVLLNTWTKSSANDLVAHIAIADTYTAMNNLEKAADYYRVLVEKYGETPVLLNNLAQIQIKLKQYQQAQGNAEKAFKALPSNNAIIDTLAWTYSLNGKYQQALPLYRQVLSKDSGNIETKYHLAYTLVKLKRVAEAKALLKEVVASNNFNQLSDAKELLSLL